MNRGRAGDLQFTDMFAGASLARRIERVEMGLVIDGAAAAARRVAAHHRFFT